ncbi:MAG: DUF294 nucleotidyltransferase-like domain-containing protein [Gammaproteobacteria bacterium]|nr:DUF294 nucleotidyltransferase-like domain-containing protein [Gammaproteobacteria bacterium]MDH5776724.1 DUF294 nucleotidyltransferase-like domain-containing protein [Gammaproteobacteria bacterium]
MQPPKHTPLIALPTLILDLETTGLDVKNDRVIQIGAISTQGANQHYLAVIDQLINPGIAIPQSSTEIHNIDDTDVARAPSFKDVATHLIAQMKNRVIIGHHIAFDLAILRHEFARNKLVWHEPLSLDVGMLASALQPNLPDVSLETVTTMLGVRIRNRHSAMGDCKAATECWQHLLPLLQKKNIRTLGEAITLANSRHDLITRQIESGWTEVPAGLVKKQSSNSKRIDSYVYEHRLADVMTQPPVFVNPKDSLRQATQTMNTHKLGSLLVGTADKPPLGILTERDVLKQVAENQHDLDNTPIEIIMTSPVESMHQDELLYRALGRMDRLNIAHLCVHNDAGLPVGIISQRNLLQYRARGPNMLSDAMDTANSVHELASAYGRLTDVARQLLDEELAGDEIAQLISTELQALTHRATELALARMKEQGKGEPPADWCALVLGSAGRGESLLSADQDNALIHTGCDVDDDWFAQFATYLSEILDQSGLALCSGGVMAINKQWRGNLADWNQQLSNWIQRAQPEDLLNVDIFFDLLPVAGHHSLANELHQQAVALAEKNHPFINLLAQSVLSVAPQFGFMGRLKLSEGRIDLKRHGLLPLVSFARTVALRMGSNSRSTSQRLRDAIQAGLVAESDAVRLIELEKLLLMLILKQQIKDRKAGLAAGTKVAIKLLAKRDQKHLKHELHHLDTMVNQIFSFITH